MTATTVSDLTDLDCDLTRTVLTVRTLRLNPDPQRRVSYVHLGLTKTDCLGLTETDYIAETTLELDSHADTCVLGRHALIILDYDRPVSVVGYDESLGTQTYKTVSGVVAYTDHMTGRTLHLVINQAIHIPHLDHHLLCPMQCRVNDVTVDETPKFLAPRLTEQTHALTVPDPDNPAQTISLPIMIRGVTSFLNVRNVPSEEFYKNETDCIHLTSETLTWDPHTTIYEESEAAMINYSGDLARDVTERGPSLIINALHSLTVDAVDITHDCNFHHVLKSNVVISSLDTSLNGHMRSRKTAPIDSLTLAARWMISPERTKRTVQQTTQRGVRTCLNPSLARRFPTNDRMLRYKRLPHPTFTDTCSLERLPGAVTSVRRFMPHRLGGHVHTL